MNWQRFPKSIDIANHFVFRLEEDSDCVMMPEEGGVGKGVGVELVKSLILQVNNCFNPSMLGNECNFCNI